MNINRLCSANISLSGLAKPCLVAQSLENIYKMGNGKRWKKKGSPKALNENSTTEGTNSTSKGSPQRRRSSRLVAKEPPNSPSSPRSPSTLMEIEEDSVLNVVSTPQSEHMAVSPGTMTGSATLSTPNMIQSDDDTEGSPLPVQQLFSAEITTEASKALTDTPDKASKSVAPTPIATNTPSATPAFTHVEVLPYEWRERNNEWLNLAMRASMNDASVPGIPAIDHISVKHRIEETPLKPPAPTRAYAVKYDVRIKVPAADDPVEATRQALMLILAKLQSIDKNIIIYPWKDDDRWQRIPVLAKPEDFPTMLLNLRIYVHRLYLHLDGGTCYPQIFFGFMDKPSAVMENIGWWFKSTDQGMWQMTLQKAEETTCMGWLLYSTDEFD